VSNNPLAYKVWFYTVRVRKGSAVKLPRNGDNLYFDGYPRSGNTYFVQLLVRLYPEIKYSSHLHSIAGIKIALKSKVPVIIIIRKPDDTIVSNLFRVVNSKGLKANQRTADYLTQRYLSYYSFVLNNHSKLKVLNFNKLIENKRVLMDVLAGHIGMKKYTDEKFKIMLKKNDEFMNKEEKHKNDNVSSLPNKNRDEFKVENLELVHSSPFFRAADEVYTKLIT